MLSPVVLERHIHQSHTDAHVSTYFWPYSVHAHQAESSIDFADYSSLTLTHSLFHFNPQLSQEDESINKCYNAY